MKPHVILIADAGGEIGWGHAVRQLALAEALVGKGVSTLFVTRTEEALGLDWPCPVWRVADVARCELPNPYGTAVYDLPEPCENDGGHLEREVSFRDHGPLPGDENETDYVVSPHFGAAWYDWTVPTLLGPRWAPIRRAFALYPIRNENRSGIFVYGDAPEVPKGLLVKRPHTMNARATASQIAGCTIALVPPSMIALECLAVGTPVVLYVPGPKWQPIADAMVEAGVAEIWSGAPEDYTLACVLADDGKRRRMAEAGREAVDGGGAGRLAEWLADA